MALCNSIVILCFNVVLVPLVPVHVECMGGSNGYGSKLGT